MIDSTAHPASGETFLWDAEVRGFGLRIYASGRRAFVFQYRAPDTRQSRRLAIGDFPAITVDQARALAQKAAGLIAQGVDPKADNFDALQRRTLAEVFPEYLNERIGKLAQRTSAEYLRLWNTTLAPSLGAKVFGNLDEGVVTRWHAGRHETPTLANRAVDLLSSFCAWAEKRGYRDKHSNPCVDVERYAERRRGRSLTTEEYRRLGRALERALSDGVASAPQQRRKTLNLSTLKHAAKSASDPRPANPIAVAALRFLVLSGWRELEALSLRWDALNFERGVAVLLETKSGRSERPLGASALALLASQPKHSDNPYVFPGARAQTHLADPKRLWTNVKHSAGLDGAQSLRLHDLRHSFTTIARDELGLGDHVLARLVGHRVSGMTSRYGEVRDATLRNAANSVSALIETHLTDATGRVLSFATVANRSR